jgi:hypothetical protein
MDFTVNADLSGYSAAEIADLITAGNEALDALFAAAGDAPTAAQADEAERISAEIARLSTEATTRETAAAEVAARFAAVRDARVTASTEEPEDEEVEEEEEPVEEEPVEEPVAVEAAATRAPARTSARANIAGRRPKTPARPARPAMTVTAAQDVHGFALGSQIADIDTLSRAVVSRMRGFGAPQGVKGGAMQNFAVASLQRQFDEDLVVNGSNDMEVLSRAADQSRLPGQSLVAAGGWCAPSETMYDFCVNATPEGLVSLPEVQANRGGVRFTTGPDFETVFGAIGFTQTEAQAIAGTTKGCYEVTCPSFNEVRLDAIGLCIKVPILTNAAYPELVQQTLSYGLLAHQHRVSSYAISKMVTASGSAFVPATVGGTTVNTLDGLELVVQGIRQKYRLSFDAPVEGVAPFWLKGAIRADLANRTGVDMLAISDATIDGYLRERGISLQYVYNWQALDLTDTGYPATVQVMLYPAGTFVKAVTDVINLSAVYDAASLNVNTYTGLFMEEGIAVFKRCWDSTLVTLAVDGSGRTGSASLSATFTAA